MRLCPSVEGSPAQLITHRIGADVCLTRQCANFHKCHRCIYRGQAVDWEPEPTANGMVNVHAAEEPNQRDVKKVVIPRPEAAPASPAAANG